MLGMLQIVPNIHVLGRLEVLQRMARTHASGMLGVAQARDAATYPFQTCLKWVRSRVPGLYHAKHTRCMHAGHSLQHFKPAKYVHAGHYLQHPKHAKNLTTGHNSAAVLYDLYRYQEHSQKHAFLRVSVWVYKNCVLICKTRIVLSARKNIRVFTCFFDVNMIIAEGRLSD